MRTRTSPAITAGLVLSLIPALAGGYLLALSAPLSDAEVTALGAALVGGALIAMAIFLAESRRDVRLHEAAAAQALLLQVTLSKDLSGADLRGRDLSGLSLRGKVLQEANLAGANLSRADLSGADLRGANLSGVDLRRARLVRADLTLADCRGANFERATLFFARARGTNLSGAEMRRVYGQGADFSRLSAEELTELTNLGYWGMGVHSWEGGEVLEERQTLFTYAKLTSSQWTGASFEGAYLWNADLSWSILGPGERKDPLADVPSLWQRFLLLLRRDERIRGQVNLHGVGIPTEAAVFDGAEMRGAVFAGCSGPGVRLTDAQVAECDVPLEESERAPA